jgi:hypothetical protein
VTGECAFAVQTVILLLPPSALISPFFPLTKHCCDPLGQGIALLLSHDRSWFIYPLPSHDLFLSLSWSQVSPLAVFGVFNVCGHHHTFLLLECSPLKKVRWFSRLAALKEKKHQATRDNYQNGNDPNQSNRHLFSLLPLLLFP